MRFENYIWDFDGTLVDSYPHIFASLRLVMDEYGMTEKFDMDMVYRQMRVSFAEMRKYTNMADEPYAKFNALHHQILDSEIDPPIVPFREAEWVLSAIVEKGGQNFLYTHRNITAYYYLFRFGLIKYFTDIVTSENNFPSKPAPDAIRALMKKHALRADETIMIGDREIDGLSGQNAGIAGALVNYPEHLPDGTSPAEASDMDCIASSLTSFAKMCGILPWEE